MSDMKCVITVPDIGQCYQTHVELLAQMGVAAHWRRNAVGNSQDEAVVGAACRGYDFVIAANEKWGATALSTCADTLRLLVRYGIGYDNVDVEAAVRLGVTVTTLPGCNARSVAEQAVALMLAAAHDIPRLDAYLKSGATVGQTRITKSVAGKTIGLLGCGNIGKEVVRLLSGFGCSFLAYDPAPDIDFGSRFNVRFATWEETLSQSDIVSLHLPLNESTRHIIGGKNLSLMKPDAILVNTARGQLLHSEDVAQALREGRLYAAGLDVFENEGKIDRPLAEQFIGLENIAMTPHTGSLTLETFDRMMNRAVEAIGCFLSNRPLPGLLTGG